MCDTFRREFRVANFGLSHHSLDAHALCQWRWNRGIFLAYRIFTAAWSTGCFLYLTLSTIGLDLGNNIMTFLTTWTYLVLTLYLVSSAIVTVMHSTCFRPCISEKAQHTGISNVGVANLSFEDHEKQAVVTITNGNKRTKETDQTNKLSFQHDTQITWYMKVTWCLGTIVYVFAIIVTFVYFGALFPLIGHTNFIDFNVHGVNTIFILVDAFLVARPVRVLHLIYPFMYGLCYLVFSAIYWNADRENHVLYPGVLDWNYPGKTAVVVCLLSFIALPLLQLLHFGIYRLRLYIFQKVYDTEYDEI